MANSKTKTRKKIIVFSVIILVIIGASLYAYYKRPDPFITVNTEKVARRNLTELVVATGKIQPVNYAKISPEVSGEIVELPVKEGQDVKKGDVLMRIKPDTYVANRNIAEANYKAAQAQNMQAVASCSKAESEFKRYQDMFDSKLVAESQYVEAKTTLDIAKASLQASTHQMDNARANLARAEEDLSKTTIVSPLTGTVTKLNSQLGERVVGTATYQGTEVMTISDLNDMEARVDIGEVDVVLIGIGQKARLEVDSFRDKKFTGKVSQIANTAKTSGAGSQQEATKFEVRIQVQEKDGFRPGMSVTAEIETRYRTNVLTVPIQSVTTRLPKEPSKEAKGKVDADGGSKGSKTNETKATQTAQATNTSSTNSQSNTNLATNAPSRKAGEAPKPIEVVFAVEGGQAKMLPVKRGISDDSYVEITEGLSEEKEIVAGGYKAISKDLEDGKKIKVDNNKKSFDKEEKKS